MGAQGGHKARPYSANDALTTYPAVQIQYRICAVDHLGFHRAFLSEDGLPTARPATQVFCAALGCHNQSRGVQNPRSPLLS